MLYKTAAADAPRPPGGPVSDTPIKVGVSVRVVPSGIVTLGGRTFVQAALVLSPANPGASPDAGDLGKKIDLRAWPSEIETALRLNASDTENWPANESSIEIEVQSVDQAHRKPSASGSKRLSAFRALYHERRMQRGGSNLKFADWQKERAKEVDEITALWRLLLAPATADNPWGSLAEVIGQGGGNLLDSLKRENQATTGAGQAPQSFDVAGMGRGEAALVLATERARLLLERRKRFSSDAKAASLPINFAYEPFDPLNWSRGWPSWAGPVPSLVRYASADGAAAAGPQSAHEKVLNEAREAVDRQVLAIQRGESSSVPNVAARVLGAATEASVSGLSGMVNSTAALHEGASAVPKAPDAASCPPISRQDAARARLVGLQSQPSLARLFNLVVDVLIPIEAFESAATSGFFIESPPKSGRKARFAYLSGVIRESDATRRTWTATKFRTRAEGGPDAWACTRAEIDTALDAKDADAYHTTLLDGTIESVDGFVPLGAAALDQQNKPLYRFDLLSIDAVQATDNRLTALFGIDRKGQQILTLRTSGLALYDHGRQRAAVRLLVASHDRQVADSKTETIDAADLTIGYRLDIGVQKDGAVEWRDLCRRTIAFGDPPDVARPVVARAMIERLLSHAVPVAEKRAAFDSATLILPARLQPKTLDQKTAYVDETVAHWTGPPLGADPDAGDIVLSDNCSALRLSQTYSLAKPEGWPGNIGWTIPRLVISGGYYEKLRVVQAGGIVRPVDSAASRLDQRLAIPAGAAPRRHLRHERIETPLVSAPLAMLNRPLDGVADGIRETGTTMIVRSRANPDRQASQPSEIDREHASSVRIVIPPVVSAAFADSHKLLIPRNEELIEFIDDNNRIWKGPRDGLRDVDFDHRWVGGFPAWTFVHDSSGRLDDGTATAEPMPKANGDSVFRPRKTDRKRRVPYYPDPLADYLVFQVKDGSGRILQGVPLVVPVRPEGVSYPDIRPVAVAMVARSDKKLLTHENVIGVEAVGGSLLRGAAVLEKEHRLAVLAIDADGKFTKQKARPGEGVAVTRVEFAVPPGESLSLEVWCLPTKLNLARHFDVIETATLLAAYDSGAGAACGECWELESRISTWTGARPEQVRKRLEANIKQSGGARVTAAGQRQLDVAAIRTMNDLMYEMASCTSTPEIAASATITAIHAVDRPLAKPQSTLRVDRVGSSTFEAVLKGAALPTAAEAGEKGILLSGTLTFDPVSTGFVEIMASGESLASGRFDKPEERARSSDEVARGHWPTDPATGGPKQPIDLYGFHIASDGTVRFEEEEAVLLRIDCPTGPWPSNDLLTLLRYASDDAVEPHPAPDKRHGVQVTSQFKLADTRARRLKLWIRTGSRTSIYFRNPETGRALSAEETVVEGEKQTLILPATTTPSPLTPLSVLPSAELESYRTNARTFEVIRKPFLYVSWHRPGATSGPAERIGVVLWPPDLELGRGSRISADNNSVERDYDTNEVLQAIVPSVLHRRDIDMKAFADADLGPGGAYVTRWGQDPIAGGPGPPGWLIPASAFPGLKDALIDSPNAPAERRWNPQSLEEPEILYVPRIALRNPGESTGEKVPDSSRLQVALLTYKSRFDADQETWFAHIPMESLGVAEPFVRLGLVRFQPHAAPHLRVSEPVTEWAQIMPRRHVVVSVPVNDPKLVKVTITGTGSPHAAHEPDGHDPCRLSWWRQRPLMRVTILCRTSSGVDMPAALDRAASLSCAEIRSPWAERTFIPATQKEWDDYLTHFDPQDPAACKPAETEDLSPALPPFCAVRPEAGGSGEGSLRWEAEFRLEDDPLKATDCSYSVFVEEVVAMRPATYSHEPVDELNPDFPSNDELIISGPKFAARVELK